MPCLELLIQNSKCSLNPRKNLKNSYPPSPWFCCCLLYTNIASNWSDLKGLNQPISPGFSSEFHITHQRRLAQSDLCSSDDVRFTILKPEPPTRALGSQRRKGKRKSSFQSDHSRCAIGTEHLKLKPADRQQGPHVYTSAARASISAFCFSFFSFLFYRVKSLSRAASGMRFSCHTSSVLVK